MSNPTLPGDDELAFERLLLGAGLAEPLPHDRTEAAKVRFLASVAALQGGALGAAAIPTDTAGSIGRPRTSLVVAGKWLVLGVVAGGIGTFAWLRQTTPSAARHDAKVLAVAPQAAAPSAEAVKPEPAPQLGPLPPAKASLEPQRSRRSSGASRAAQLAVKSGPDLAAEVAALDGIRTAISIGALQNAELELARYRREFGRGALRSEAEVLGLELLVAQGRKQAAKSASERFISRHPRDPQVARVRALVE